MTNTFRHRIPNDTLYVYIIEFDIMSMTIVINVMSFMVLSKNVRLSVFFISFIGKEQKTDRRIFLHENPNGKNPSEIRLAYIVSQHAYN